MEKPISKLFKKSSFVVLFISLATAIVSSLPYFYGYLFPKSGLVFLGRSVVNSADTYVYLSNIISAQEGKVILPNLYTTESKVPFLIKPLYYSLGRISSLTNLPPVAIFHFSRFFLTIIFVLMLYKFISLFIKKESGRFVALLVVLFSSGLGFFVRQVLPGSIDLWVPEANTFFSLLEAPHFISTQIFLLLYIYFLYQYIEARGRKYLFYASISSSLVILDHPFMTPFIFSFSFVSFVFLFKTTFYQRLTSLFYFLLLPIVSVGIVLFLAGQSYAASLMQSQNILPTPSFENLVYGYGLLLPFSLFGCFSLNLSKGKNRLLVIWLALTSILIYLPFSFQRRLVEGVHIPLSILATIGIFFLYQKIKTNLVRWLFIVALAIILPITNLYNLWHMFQSFKDDSATNYIYYLDRDEMAGIKWLAGNSVAGDTILANFFYSNIIPGVTGRFVYHGHRIQTFASQRKQLAFDKFMKEDDQVFRQKFLKANGIDYIYLGKNDPYSQFLGSLEEQSYLEKVWQKKGVAIFRVVIDTI